jgi:hypothetical protein
MGQVSGVFSDSQTGQLTSDKNLLEKEIRQQKDLYKRNSPNKRSRKNRERKGKSGEGDDGARNEFDTDSNLGSYDESDFQEYEQENEEKQQIQYIRKSIISQSQNLSEETFDIYSLFQPHELCESPVLEAIIVNLKPEQLESFNLINQINGRLVDSLTIKKAQQKKRYHRVTQLTWGFKQKVLSFLISMTDVEKNKEKWYYNGIWQTCDKHEVGWNEERF